MYVCVCMCINIYAVDSEYSFINYDKIASYFTSIALFEHPYGFTISKSYHVYVIIDLYH